MTDFGTDISTFRGLDETFTPISGARVVAEAIARRLVTPRGALPFHPDYGLDLRRWLCESFTQADLARCKAAVEAECLKDERVAAVSATVALRAGALSVKVSGQTSMGPFRLVLGISELNVELLSID